MRVILARKKYVSIVTIIYTCGYIMFYFFQLSFRFSFLSVSSVGYQILLISQISVWYIPNISDFLPVFSQNFFWLGISKKKKIAFFPLALQIDYKPLDINPRETAIIPMFRQPLHCCCVGHSESLREHPMTSSETFKLQKVFSSLHLKISSFFWLPSGLRLGLSSAPNVTFGFFL